MCAYFTSALKTYQTILRWHTRARGLNIRRGPDTLSIRHVGVGRTAKMSSAHQQLTTVQVSLGRRLSYRRGNARHIHDGHCRRIGQRMRFELWVPGVQYWIIMLGENSSYCVLCNGIKCSGYLVLTWWKHFEGSSMTVCCKGTLVVFCTVVDVWPRSLKSTVDHDRWETTGQRRFRVNRTISSVNHCLSFGASYCLLRRTMRTFSHNYVAGINFFFRFYIDFGSKTPSQI